MKDQSNKALDERKKKLGKTVNPVEGREVGSSDSLESEDKLTKRSMDELSDDDVLKRGFGPVALDVDPFDNERNYQRMRPDQDSDVEEQKEIRDFNREKPSPGYGPRYKCVEPEEDDYED